MSDVFFVFYVFFCIFKKKNVFKYKLYIYIFCIKKKLNIVFVLN